MWFSQTINQIYKKGSCSCFYLEIWCQISNNFDVLLCNMGKYCSSFYINTFFLYKTLFTCLNATEEADPGEIVNPSSSGNGYVPRSCIETRIPASGARADMYSLCWILNSKVKPGRKKKYFKNPTTFCPMHYSQYIRHQWVNWNKRKSKQPRVSSSVAAQRNIYFFKCFFSHLSWLKRIRNRIWIKFTHHIR